RVVPARYHADGTVEWLPVRPLPVEQDLTRTIPPGTIPMGLPPHVALRMLRAGHRRFLGDARPAPDLTAARREQLANGEQPIAIVLTDTDSRIAPEHVFDAGLGELVVIRVAGGVVTDNVLASIEQAAGHTGASLLIVMGHSRCDAMAAAATHPEGRQLTPNMRALLAHLEPSIERVRGAGAPGTEALVERAVTANVLRTATEIRARSGILRELERRGRFAVLPTVYDVASGNLTWLKEGQEDGAEPAAAPHGETGAGGHDAHGDAVSHAGDHAPAHGDGGHGGSHGGSHGNGHDEAPQTSGDHAGSGHAAGPLLEWADPEATRPAHGAHGEPAEHGAPGHGTSGHGDAGHGANEHGSGNHGPVDHGASEHGAGGHGSGGHEAGAHDAGDHGAGDHEAGAHGAGEHDAPADHGEHGHGDASTVRHAASPWQDPILIVGMAGVASLLLAAFVALVKR
ncbi:MAG: hypothetical protein KDE27_07240, partial [Planctomycetes bacterium]|nr:hypothetical protein [Planctomycetota bacterium]